MDRVKISYFMDALCVWAYVSQVRIDEMKASFVEAVELGRVLICGRPARCKRFLKKIGT